MLGEQTMPTFFRIILLAAAVLLSAQPVMACCLQGHSAAVEVTPPCHEMPSEEDRAGNLAGDDCPGCADCETALVASDVKPSKPLLDPSFAKAVLYASAQIAEVPEVTLNGATGPPRTSLNPPPNPVSLYQKLLI
jgi:hypothetical protein